MSDSLIPVVVKIVGGSTSSAWAQVFLSEEDSSLPRLFFTLAVLNEGDTESASVGKELAQSFLQDFSAQKDKPLENLQQALEKLTVEAKEKNVLVDLSCGVLWHGCLYAATIGEGKIYFQRGKKFVELVRGEKEIIKTISGFLEEHDLLILCSASFSTLVSSQTLFSNLDHKPLEEIVEALSPIVLGSPDSSLAASLFVKFKREMPEEPAQEEPVVKEEIKEEKIQEVVETAVKSSGVSVFFKVKSIFGRISFPLVSNLMLPNWKKSLASDAGKLSFSQSRSKKTILTVAVILLVLLSTSVIFGIAKKAEEKDHAIFSKVYDESKAKVDEGKAIIDLNPTLARSLLSAGKTESLSVLGQLKNKNSDDYKSLVALGKEADGLLITISHVYKISNPDLFYDLSLIKDKAVGAKFNLYQNSLAILDTVNSAVYSLQTDTKSADVVAGGQNIADSLFLGTHGDKIHVFSSTNGIVEVNVKDKVTKTAIKPDSNWGQIKGLVDFAGNIYLLDSKKGQIVKYITTDQGLSEAKNYLRPDVTPDLSQSVSMTIDGSIWVLNSSGLISKYTQGRPDNFNISGLDVGFSAPQVLFTYDDAKNIYVLDKNNNRVVVLAKTGEYVAQYQWPGIKSVTDMVADEKLGKILLLSGNKIYSINLK